MEGGFAATSPPAVLPVQDDFAASSDGGTTLVMGGVGGALLDASSAGTVRDDVSVSSAVSAPPLPAAGMAIVDFHDDAASEGKIVRLVLPTRNSRGRPSGKAGPRANLQEICVCIGM